MAAATLDYSGLLVGIPVGSWVAISSAHTEVLAYGPDVEDVAKKAKEKGEKVPLIVLIRDPEFAMFL